MKRSIDAPASYATHGSSQLLREYQAELIFTIERDGAIHIIKNRRGVTGEIGVETAIEMFSHIITKRKFKGIMKLFQEGMKREIIKAIKNVINEYMTNRKGGDKLDTL